MNFKSLAGKIGGVAKEAARGALTGELLNFTGNNAMTGQVNYADYEYDANGHIKGINTKFAKEVETLYEDSGVKNTTGKGIDGSFGGLTTGTPRAAKTDFAEKYPGKYDNSANNYKSFKSSYEKKIEEDNKKIDNGGILSNINIGGINVKSAVDSISSTPSMFPNTNTSSSKQNSKQDSLYGLVYNNVSTDNYNKYNAADNQNKVINNPISDVFSIKLPDWSYADFINERAIWQKGLSSIFDEPGWFYFKIFFDFDTDHGLFGGLLNSKYLTNAVNSAAKYLYSIRNLHRYIKPKDRINSLYKFASILSYINTNAPWYFKSVKGLNKAAVPIIDDFSKENAIELELTQDAIDMRLSTLMSLYNYACFDSITDREIIPKNLRKFNMSVVIFQTPLRYLHTSYTSNKKTEFMGIDVGGIVDEVGGLFGKKKKGSKMVKYKTMNPNHGETSGYQNMMSMKVYTFMGCEFDRESFGSIIPGSVSNESPFQLGNSSIKITYTSCAEHTMNEFYAMMFGTDGFYFNQYSNYQLALNEGGTWNGYVTDNQNSWNEQLDRYQSLYDTFEDIAKGGTILGLIDKPKTYKKAIDATEAIMNGLFDNPGMLKGLATNFALGLLGSSKDTKAPQGNIYGDYGIGSAYYKDKLEMLKNGVHENTMAPYYYDPDTGARIDFHKDKQYSAYSYKNTVSSIKNFNVTNWLSTQTQKAASGINNVLRSGMDSLFGYDTGDFTQRPYKRPTSHNRQEGNNKNHSMVDDESTWTRTTKPYAYDPKEAINNINIENNEHKFTMPPYSPNL